MTVEVALAMLQRQGRWLLQLRDDRDGIVAPGCWGLFGGHLELDETPVVALRRELVEEICWCPARLDRWFQHRSDPRVVHVFTGHLDVPLSQLQLLEGQDMTLASVDEILHGRIWSRRLNQERQLAPALTLLTERLHELNQAD